MSPDIQEGAPYYPVVDMQRWRRYLMRFVDQYDTYSDLGQRYDDGSGQIYNNPWVDAAKLTELYTAYVDVGFGWVPPWSDGQFLGREAIDQNRVGFYDQRGNPGDSTANPEERYIYAVHAYCWCQIWSIELAQQAAYANEFGQRGRKGGE